MTNSNFTEEEAKWVAENVLGEKQGVAPALHPSEWWQKKYMGWTFFMHHLDLTNWLNSDAAVMPIIRGLERMELHPDIVCDSPGYVVSIDNDMPYIITESHPDIAAALRLAVKELIKLKGEST